MPAVPCHYATQPDTRPNCQVTAVIRRGRTPLCASCDVLRSTLGKGQAATPLPATPSADLLHQVSRAQSRLHDAEAELTAAVTQARQQGHPWAAIGARLGISRQAAQQRFGRRLDREEPIRVDGQERYGDLA